MTPAEIEAYEASLIIADVLEALETVDEAWAGQIGTHYPGCWVRHAQCLSLHIRSLIEDGDQDHGGTRHHDTHTGAIWEDK